MTIGTALLILSALLFALGYVSSNYQVDYKQQSQQHEQGNDTEADIHEHLLASESTGWEDAI